MVKCETLRVPIIHQDLRPEETIVQIANALDYLSHAINNIFQHIEVRVEKQTKKLTEIKERGEVVRLKVEKLASANNKATIVFSSAKYPAADVNRDYSYSFEPSPAPSLPSNIKYRDKPLLSPSDDFSEKLKFYHVKVSSKLLRKNMDIAVKEGLGSLPPDLSSVSSLLLFNTAENLYKKYVMLDPLGVATKTRLPVEGDSKNEELDAAPMSLSRGDQLDQKSIVNYFYAPLLEEVPQIDVPLDLPDLPGIADDLRFNVDVGPIITPSQASTPAVAELPPLPTLEVPILPITSAPAPPLPPSPPPTPPPILDSPSFPPVPPPPPPPPPLSPELERVTQQQSTTTAVQQLKPKVPEASMDAHATLMEAIRKAGGSGKAKLRSAIDRKIEAKRQKQEEKEIGSGTGDLMADLHAKLAMRRKGISGQIDAESIMGKISAMIPPPKPGDTESEDENDDDISNDWDD